MATIKELSELLNDPDLNWQDAMRTMRANREFDAFIKFVIDGFKRCRVYGEMKKSGSSRVDLRIESLYIPREIAKRSFPKFNDPAYLDEDHVYVIGYIDFDKNGVVEIELYTHLFGAQHFGSILPPKTYEKWDAIGKMLYCIYELNDSSMIKKFWEVFFGKAVKEIQHAVDYMGGMDPTIDAKQYWSNRRFDSFLEGGIEVRANELR